MLARTLARQSSQRGRPVIVWDPNAPNAGPNAAGWSAEFVTPCWDTFKSIFWQSRGCLAIVDEAPDVFEKDRNNARMMLRRGRHVVNGGGGHVVALLGVRYVGLDKTAREQCSRLYAFNQSRDDGEMIAREWNCDPLKEVYRLPKFHYITLDRMGEPRAGVVKIPS